MKCLVFKIKLLFIILKTGEKKMSNNRGLVIIDLAMEYYVTIKNQDLEEYLLNGEMFTVYF